jgi:predicted TIM-barrel fold metal-dependent hydrolase
VADVDDVASAFPGLRFIVEHVGLPRLEDFCWIATREPNVYGGLAVDDREQEEDPRAEHGRAVRHPVPALDAPPVPA